MIPLVPTEVAETLGQGGTSKLLGAMRLCPLFS